MGAPLDVHVIYHPSCAACHQLLSSDLLSGAREKYGSRLRWWLHDATKPETQGWINAHGLKKRMDGYPTIFICGPKECNRAFLGVPDREDFHRTLNEFLGQNGG